MMDSEPRKLNYFGLVNRSGKCALLRKGFGLELVVME
jgi:hypothetical protein